MVCHIIISFLYSCSICFTLNSNPFFFRFRSKYSFHFIFNVIFNSHFKINISIVKTFFIWFIEYNITRTDIKLIPTKRFAFHSKSSASTIYFFSNNPRIFIVKNPRHILYTFFICFLYPSRPVTSIFLFAVENK